MYKHVLERVTKASGLKRLKPEEINELRSEFPSLPEDYLIFMQEVGWGNIGGMMIYSGAGTPEHIYPDLVPPAANVIVFGDDWQGTCFGFDLDRQCSLVQISPEGEIHRLDEEFGKFIVEYAN